MLSKIQPGKNTPEDINVFIEISAYGPPIKYEVDKLSGLLTVDRIMPTTMQYPCNYGFVPQTLSEDKDPLDVLVITPAPLQPSVIINCRPVGMLKMRDESGTDIKIIAVPTFNLTSLYNDVSDLCDLPTLLLKQIEHFFQHYKDLDSNKWVKIEGFENVQKAKKNIEDCVKRFNS